MSSNEKQTRCCYAHKAPTNLEARDPETGSGRTQLLGCGNWITSLLSYTSGLKVFFLDSEIALGNGSNLQSLHHQQIRRLDLLQGLRIGGKDGHERYLEGCELEALLQADTFDLNCFQSLTGTKFFVVSEPVTQHMEGLLKHIYELYTRITS